MKKISEGNKGIQALAKKNPSLVEDKFGYDVPGYMNGGMPMQYMQSGGMPFDPSTLMNLGNMMPQPGPMSRGSSIGSANINVPDNIPGNPRGLESILSGDMIGGDPYNIMDPDFKFDPDLSVEYDEDNPYDMDKSAFDNYMENTRTVEDDARDDLEESVETAKQEAKQDRRNRIMQGLGALGDIESMMGDTPQMTQGYSIGGTKASKVGIQRFRRGGMPNFNGRFMQDEFIFDDFDINDYIDNVLGRGIGRGGIGGYVPPTEEEIAEQKAKQAAARLARGYGGTGAVGGSSYGSQTPGASISIDARDETPDAYRFYPSEVSKLYSQMKGTPFSPLVAPPKEATYIDDLQPRRITSQLYAADGKFVDRSELITGPGGERGDKIPAMLSDGEFVVNAEAVRGMGVAAGANPQDEYEQRLEGARQMYALQKEGEQMMRKYR
jgi:hypothetical protein